MLKFVEEKLRARFVRLHGEGAENQVDVYRCQGCKALIDWKTIQANSHPPCGSRKLSPAVLSTVEKVRLLLW